MKTFIYSVAVASLVNLAGQWSGAQPIRVELPGLVIGLPGNSITVPIRVDDLTGRGIIAYQTTISFDKTVLSAGGASSAGTLSGAFGLPTVNTTIEGEITVGGFGTAPLEGSGILVNLFFNVVGQLGDQTPLTFVKFLFNGGDPQADTQDGQFQVALPTGIFTPVARLNILQLGQNFPNPFNPQTAIPLQVPPGWEKPLSLRIYNAKGQIVRTLAQRRYVPGRHIFYWDSKNEEGRPVPSGVYFYKIQSGRFIISKRMVLLR